MVQKIQKNIKKVPLGIFHIHSTFNNTIITITDLEGNTLSWASAGTSGFKGARKSTPFAAQMAAEKAIKNALSFDLKKVRVVVKGQGSGRETAIRVLKKVEIVIVSIEDVTSIPHNGCRLPKPRRV